MTHSDHTPTGWPTATTASAGELRGMARERLRYADELSAQGLGSEADRHWRLAESYLDLARAVTP